MKDDGMPTASETATAQRDSIEQSKRTNGLMVRRATIEEAALLVEAMGADPDSFAPLAKIAAAIRAMPVQTP